MSDKTKIIEIDLETTGLSKVSNYSSPKTDYLSITYVSIALIIGTIVALKIYKATKKD